MNFDKAEKIRQGMLTTYYGSMEEVKGNQPMGLLEETVKINETKEEGGVPEVLAITGEWDPEDDIAGPMRAFGEVWRGKWGGIREEILVG